MMKSKALKWIIIIAVIVGIIWWLTSNNNESSSEGSTTTSKSNIDRDRVLKNGMRGKEVKVLQRHLNKKGSDLEVDGIFGPLTKKALQNHYDRDATTLNAINA